MVVTETGFICLNDNYCGFEAVFRGKNGSGSKVRTEKCTGRVKNLIIKTDTLKIRFLELIGILGKATSDENKCFSKTICIPFSAVQTKIIPDDKALLMDKYVLPCAD